MTNLNDVADLRKAASSLHDLAAAIERLAEDYGKASFTDEGAGVELDLVVTDAQRDDFDKLMLVLREDVVTVRFENKVFTIRLEEDDADEDDAEGIAGAFASLFGIAVEESEDKKPSLGDMYEVFAELYGGEG